MGKVIFDPLFRKIHVDNQARLADKAASSDASPVAPNDIQSGGPSSDSTSSTVVEHVPQSGGTSNNSISSLVAQNTPALGGSSSESLATPQVVQSPNLSQSMQGLHIRSSSSTAIPSPSVDSNGNPLSFQQGLRIRSSPSTPTPSKSMERQTNPLPIHQGSPGSHSMPTDVAQTPALPPAQPDQPGIQHHASPSMPSSAPTIAQAQYPVAGPIQPTQSTHITPRFASLALPVEQTQVHLSNPVAQQAPPGLLPSPFGSLSQSIPQVTQSPFPSTVVSPQPYHLPVPPTTPGGPSSTSSVDQVNVASGGAYQPFDPQALFYQFMASMAQSGAQQHFQAMFGQGAGQNTFAPPTPQQQQPVAQYQLPAPSFGSYPITQPVAPQQPMQNVVQPPTQYVAQQQQQQQQQQQPVATPQVALQGSSVVNQSTDGQSSSGQPSVQRTPLVVKSEPRSKVDVEKQGLYEFLTSDSSSKNKKKRRSKQGETSTPAATPVATNQLLHPSLRDAVPFVGTSATSVATPKKKRTQIEVMNSKDLTEYNYKVTNPLTGKKFSTAYQESTPSRLRSMIYSAEILPKILASTYDEVLILEGSSEIDVATQIAQIRLANNVHNGIKDKEEIGVIQSCSLKALSTGRSIAKELDVALGEHVAIRTKDKTFDNTNVASRITVATVDILLEDLEHDPLLKKYDMLILDDIFSRDYRVDIIIGKLYALLKSNARKRFRIVLLCADANVDTIRSFFPVHTAVVPSLIKVTTISIPPNVASKVSTLSTGTSANIEESLVANLRDHITNYGKTSNVTLIFLPGEEEVLNVVSRLKELCGQLGQANVKVLPLFQGQSIVDQEAILEDNVVGKVRFMKIVVSTEEGATLNIDVDTLIESGLKTVMSYNACRNHHRDLVIKISKAEINRRKAKLGKAGSLGRFIQLYSDEEVEKMPDYVEPSILHIDTIQWILVYLSSLTEVEISSGLPPLPTPPTPQNVVRALHSCLLIGAITVDLNLTQVGKISAKLGVNPMLIKALMTSKDLGCMGVMVYVIASLCVDTSLFKPAHGDSNIKAVQDRFKVEYGDALSEGNLLIGYDTYHKRADFAVEFHVNVAAAEKALKIKNKIVETMKASNLWDEGNLRMNHPQIGEAIVRSLLSGLFPQLVEKNRDNDTYCSSRERTRNQILHKPEGTVVDWNTQWVIYFKAYASDEGDEDHSIMRGVTPVPLPWAREAIKRYSALNVALPKPTNVVPNPTKTA